MARKNKILEKSLSERVTTTIFIALVVSFFMLPLLWLILAPFDGAPSYRLKIPHFGLQNFEEMKLNPYAYRSLMNSAFFSAGTGLMVILVGAPASYVLSRVKFKGRDSFLYLLLLFSSIVTGSAAMVPLFLLALRLNILDTYHGVILVLTGGLIPAAIFILKDFTDSIPKSYEESAQIFGASSFRILKDIVTPVIRPGLAVIFVWSFVQAWGNFLVPFILIRDINKQPGAVMMYSFYNEGGQAVIRLVAAFSFLYTIPVVLMYFYVNRKYGFRFYGGIKG
ncbi:MAG: carbohydrate ABC transporter permease [Streptomycetaceae bacterium]|nr:MAG: carbohydrate ABC transporter permease [Streptomycetaceae bacterium]